AALAETKAKLIPPSINKDLESMLQAHERLLAGKKALVQLITELPSGATAGFSHYLEALGQQYVKGLWLSHFEFKEGGRVVNLYGSTQSAELVPDYLKKLSVETAFQGKTFGGLKLEKEENSKQARFAITTKPLPEREEQTP
ncbi:MAG TPA: PilN domain-containing protein, partial [Pseudomonadales bacterium]|nr:PilN domain-containing protein [Pseudomonadales bacterium]